MRLFSVTIKDCIVQTFRAGGKGGQAQNKVESGVRIIHEPSGAVGEARDSRSQKQNKEAAFKRMAESKKFKVWVQREAAKYSDMESPEEAVERMMQPENLRIEVRGDKGWEKE